jgi:hypothetical protein
MTEKLDIGRVFNAIIDIYRQRLGVLLTVSFAFALVNGILGAVFQDALPFILGYPLRTAVNYVIVTIFAALVIQIVVDIREGRGQRTAGDLFSAITPALVNLLLLGILYGLGVGFGLLLLIVPGLYLLTIWAVAAPVVLVERQDAIVSLRRSRELVAGNGWQVFGVLFALFLLSFVVAIIIVGLLAVALGLVGAIIGAIIVGTFLQPLDALARAVMYFELTRINQGGVASAAPVPGAVAPTPEAPPPPPPAPTPGQTQVGAPPPPPPPPPGPPQQ